jgi:hypothetical protein
VSKDRGDYYLYKVKFVNGEAVRNELFGQLQSYNDKLEKLMDSSDKEAEVMRQRASVTADKAIDSAVCSFWKHAGRFFAAFATAWNCDCTQPHYARLLLQHRTTKQSDFHLLIAAPEKAKTVWNIRETRIVEAKDNASDAIQERIMEKGTVKFNQPPDHRLAVAAKSSLRVKSNNRGNASICTVTTM